MNYTKLLNKAGVPENYHETASLCFIKAEHLSKGLTLAKWKVRLFKAKQISELLEWKDERLVDRHPDLASWDIVPVINVTAHGDNANWENVNGKDVPLPGRWLNDDPTSAEYASAVASNYWAKGEHPRSKKSRKAWYRRNAGEFNAWSRGEAISLDMDQNIWEYKDTKLHIKFQKCGNVWLMKYTRYFLKLIPITTRRGFEVDNAIRVEKANDKVSSLQLWYPVPYYELRAPVTNSTLPGKQK